VRLDALQAGGHGIAIGRSIGGNFGAAQSFGGMHAGLHTRIGARPSFRGDGFWRKALSLSRFSSLLRLPEGLRVSVVWRIRLRRLLRSVLVVGLVFLVRL